MIHSPFSKLFACLIAICFSSAVTWAADPVTYNSKAYTLKTQRGTLGTQDGYLTCSANASYKNQGKFAFINYQGETYLYSLADKKFTCRETEPYDTRNGWYNVLLSNNPVDPVKLTTTTTFADYPLYMTSNGKVFNTHRSTQKGICLNTWTKYDDGNHIAAIDPVDFDPTEALATLEALFNSGIEVTYRITDVDGTLLEQQTLGGVAGDVITSVPATFNRHAFTLYTVKTPVVLEKEKENIVEVEASFQLPFSTSPDINNAHWYNLLLRTGTEYVNAAPGYKCNPAPTPEQLISDEYQWAFQGDPYQGIILYNRSDISKTLCKNGNVATLGEGVYKWTLVEHPNGFLLANNEDGKFINEYQGSGGHLAFWNNVNDVNSIFTINEVGVVTNVKLPSSTKARLQLYPAPDDKAKGHAMLVIPGGGYAYIAGGTEGADWAPMLAELGYTTAVLTYTTPPTAPDSPLQDARAALKYLRDNAASLAINPSQIGVMGFSAGGHVAATLATHTTADERPAFQVLFYPVITMDASYTHAGSRTNLLGSNPSQALVDLYSNEKQVTSETPPAYLCWGINDGTVPQANSVNYVNALKAAGVAVHTLPLNVGNHGFGFKTEFAYHNQIVNDLTAWLTDMEPLITGISVPYPASSVSPDICYNLAGQRVVKPQRGVFITARRKFLVK